MNRAARNANPSGRRRRAARAETPSDEEIENDENVPPLRVQPGRKVKAIPKKVEKKPEKPVLVRRVNDPFRSMDLRTCPQEMLASVLKYTTFETVTRIRKINKQMDYVAVKYKCNLPKMRTVCLNRSAGRITIDFDRRLITDYHYEKHECIKSTLPSIDYNRATILIVFEEFLKKIRPAQISFEGEVDQETIDILNRMRSTKKISLHFGDCNFAVPVENLASTMAKFTNSQISMKPKNTIMNQPMGTDEVLVSLLPYSGIGYYFKDGRPTFTDKTLRVARQCLPQNFTVGQYCPFSVEEVKKTMECLIEKKLIGWNFGKIQMDSMEPLEWATAELLSIPGTHVRYTTENKDRLYIGYKWGHGDIFQVRLELRQ